MIRYKITTKYGEYRSKGVPDEEKDELIKFAKEMVKNGSCFTMNMEDGCTFIIGEKLLEDCQFQIERYE